MDDNSDRAVFGAAPQPKNRGGRFLLVAVMMPFLLLAGCETTGEERVEVVLGEVLEPDQQVSEPAEGRRGRPTAAGPRKPMPPLTLTTIVGRDEAGTVEMLGQPAQVRVESPATIWTYKRGECHLEIYFYPSLRERRLQSLTYEIDGPDDQTDCLQQFGLAENGTS